MFRELMRTRLSEEERRCITEVFGGAHWLQVRVKCECDPAPVPNSHTCTVHAHLFYCYTPEDLTNLTCDLLDKVAEIIYNTDPAVHAASHAVSIRRDD